jgi:hypothetical protein
MFYRGGRPDEDYLDEFDDYADALDDGQPVDVEDELEFILPR